MGTSASGAVKARTCNIIVALAAFMLCLGLAPATSFADDAPMLASSLLDGSTAIVSEDVELVAVGPEGDAAIEPILGSFTVDGLTFAVNADGVALVSVEPSVILSGGEAGVKGSLPIPQTITYGGVTYDVTAIGPYAFYLSGTTQVSLSASIASVDDRAFRSSDVERVEVAADNPNIASFDGALYDASLTSLLLIPEGRTGVVLLPSETEVVQASLFSHCSLVEAIDVEEGGAAFASWEGLLYDASGTTLLRVPAGATDITIREGCTSIAAGAMEGCAKLERINAPATVTSISPNVFESVSTVSLPAIALQDESVDAPLVSAESASADNFVEAEGAPSQLNATVALLVEKSSTPEVDASTITVVGENLNESIWNSIGFVYEQNEQPEAYVQAAASYGAYNSSFYNDSTIWRKEVSGSRSGTTVGGVWTPMHAGTLSKFRFYDGSLWADSSSGIWRYGVNSSCAGTTEIYYGTSPSSLTRLEPSEGYRTATYNTYFRFYGSVHVIWDANGGSCSKSDSLVDYGGSFTAPIPTHPDGYIFTGWYRSDGTKAYDGGQEVTDYRALDSATFTAQWSQNIDVSFDTSSEPGDVNYSGNEKPDETISVDDDQVEIENPQRPGYVFQGWVIPDAETDNKEALDQDLVYQGDDGKWYVDASKLPDYATDGKVELTARWTSIISVDVPNAVTFYADTVTQGQESREGAASSAFGQSKVVNQSKVDLRVVGLESNAVETTDTMLGADSILKKASSATPATSAQKLLSLYPSEKAWTAEELQDPSAVGGAKAASAVDFGLDDILLEKSFAADDFTIPAGDTLNMGYRLNLTETGQELDYDKLATLEEGQCAAIANVNYSFATVTPKGPYPTGTTSDSLWFQNTDSNRGPVGIYGTADIKKAANDLAKHAENGTIEDSPYYEFYSSILNTPTAQEMADPGKDSDSSLFFQAKVIEDGSAKWYPVQLLGICQDTVAGSNGRKAGLTFGFKNGYESRRMHSASNGTNWADCELRDYLNSDFINKLSIASDLETIEKKTQLFGTAAIGQTEDKVFLPSGFEVYGTTQKSNNPDEGLQDDKFQYAWFAKGGSAYGGNAYISKMYNGSHSYWWLRSPRRDAISQFRYHMVGPAYRPESNFYLYNGTGIMTAETAFAVVPCFAL